MVKQNMAKSEVLTSEDCVAIKVHTKVPSANEWTFGTRWSYLKHRNLWYDYMSELGANDAEPSCFKYARVQCHRPRLLDYGNFVGGCKPIGDYLKHNGWITDDDPGHFECRYVQYRDRCAKTYISFGDNVEVLDAVQSW